MFNSSHPVAGLNRKKRVLLIDGVASKCDLRARVLRQMGVEVDCAADITEARALWQADSYNLVLLDVRQDAANVEAFCLEMQDCKTPQRIAYLVGKPGYLGALPGIESDLPQDLSRDKNIWSEVVASLFIDSCEQLPRRYGFVEASWRIAATRSLKDPRPRSNGYPEGTMVMGRSISAQSSPVCGKGISAA